MAVFSIIVTFLLKVTHGFIVPSGNKLCSLKLKAKRFDLYKKKPLEESGLILLSPRRVRQWDCKRKDHGVMLFCPPMVRKMRNTKKHRESKHIFSKSASSIEKYKTVPAVQSSNPSFLLHLCINGRMEPRGHGFLLLLGWCQVWSYALELTKNQEVWKLNILVYD